MSKADVAVSWSKGSSSVEKSDKYEISSEGTVHTLVIKKATEEDIAEYACVAENVRRRCKMYNVTPNAKYQQVLHQYEDLGWVDFDPGSSAVCPILLRQMIFRQKWLSNRAR